jgi:hypothetical protein
MKILGGYSLYEVGNLKSWASRTSPCLTMLRNWFKMMANDVDLFFLGVFTAEWPELHSNSYYCHYSD